MRLVITTVLGLLGVLFGGCLDPSADGNLVPKTVTEDPSLPQLAFNDSVFHLEAFGDEDAPVIIMLHGGPGSDYRSMLGLRREVDGRRLEDTHRVIFWDQRGAGLSQRHSADEIDLATYEADLDWLVDHFSPDQPVVLVGHSWGAMYATEYISRHPSKVAGTVLIEPGPLTGALFEEFKEETVDLDLVSEWLNDYAWAHSVVSPDDHARADYLRLVGMLAGQPEHGVTQDDLPLFWREGAVASAAMQEEGVKDGKAVWDFTTGLDDFDVPVTFVASERNHVYGEALQRRQMDVYRDAELVVIPGAGHEMPTTHPRELLRVIFEYLEQNDL
jgi:proline iminopeptidase